MFDTVGKVIRNMRRIPRQENSPASKNLTCFHGFHEKLASLLHKGTGHKHHRWRTICQKLFHIFREVPVHPLHQITGNLWSSRIGWPIRLRSSKPFREHTDDFIGRVHPSGRNPIDRRQTEFIPESVERRANQWIYDHLIRDPPIECF